MNLRTILASSLVLAASAIAVPSASAATELVTSNDFFSTAWSFTAPFVRGNYETPARASLGVSTANPFLQGGASANSAWEETTYFQFNVSSLGLTSPVEKAMLRASMVTRPFGNAVSTAAPFYISAHQVSADPLTSIDPALASGAGSYIDYKGTHIGTALDTVAVTGVGSFEWDVTDLVNEWIANGETNADYSIAMTGRVGNIADDANNGIFHAFVNLEANAAGAARLLITVPEPVTGASVLSLGALCLTRQRRRA